MRDLNFELNLLSDYSVRKMIADVNNVLASRRSDLSFAEADSAWEVINQQLMDELKRRVYGEAQEDE